MIEETIYQYDPQIYPRLLWVGFNISSKTLKRLFLDDWDDEDIESSLGWSVKVHKSPTSEVGYLILFRDDDNPDFIPGPDVISHEATHSAISILDDMGIPINIENSESLAYLTGWVVRCIYEALGKYQEALNNENKLTNEIIKV